jgi:hypothetical protein
VLYSEVAFRHCHGKTTVNYETNQFGYVNQAKPGTKYVSNKRDTATITSSRYS